MACRFNPQWLLERDVNGTQIKTWGKQITHDSNCMYCCACEKKISVARGIHGINQHAKGRQHKDNIKIKFDVNQRHLGKSTENVDLIKTPQAEASTAELLWVLRILSKNQSFESVIGLKEILQINFPQSQWLQYFSLSPRKVAYLTTYALQPYFSKIMLADINGHFTLLYDETTNKACQKEFQIKIMYWSEKRNEVIFRHLQSKYIQYATAEDILKHIRDTVSDFKLNINYLLMLGSDGPNVNKKVLRVLSTDLLATRKLGLIDIGTCNLHVINNAFLKGLSELGQNVIDLVVGLHYFFKDKPTRWYDYEQTQKKVKVPLHSFIKHVPSRWLTLQPATDRLLEQWPAVVEYFLKFIPSKKNISKTATYKTIKQLLTIPTIKQETVFISNCAKLFANFSKQFQSNEPLIHLIYDEVKHLFTQIVVKFCKPETISFILENKFTENTFTVNNMIGIENYKDILGPEITDDFNRLKLPESERYMFAKKAQNHYIAICSYIAKSVPIFSEDSFISTVRCINPKFIKTSPSRQIVKLAKSIPCFDSYWELDGEWKLLCLEDLSLLDNIRIDHFWKKIFDLKINNVPKYPNLKIVVKALLSLSHGNADVERGFSLSARVMTKDRNQLSENTLNAIITVQDAIKYEYDNKVENVIVTPELSRLAKNAFHLYEEYLEKKKQEEIKLRDKQKLEAEANELARKTAKLKEKEHKNLKELEENLKQLSNKEQAKNKAATQLLTEANEKLKKALASNNLVEANIAHGLIQAAHTMVKEENLLQQEAAALQKSVNKRKSDLLTYFSKRSKIE